MTVPQSVYWPAEWAQHRGTLMAWPHDPETWPGAFDAIPDRFETLVREIARFEKIWLLAGSELALQQTRDRFANDEQIEIVDLPTNDIWTRDYGPIVVFGTELADTELNSPDGASSAGASLIRTAAAVDWIYNGWGEKYPPFDRDEAVARKFARRLDLPILSPQLVVEGGAIEGNGAGVVLTTRSCLLNANRNPNFSEGQVTELLQQYLGAAKVVWLDGGDFCGDDTDGHIDQLARFTSEHTVLHATCRSDDANRQTLQRLRQQLQDQLPGCDLVGLPIPQVHHKSHRKSHRLPASYCNFTIVNGAVIAPTFGVAEDDAALAILREQFSDRQIVPVNCRELVWGLGAIHCMTLGICH